MRSVELRIACYPFSKNPFFPFNSPCLESRSRLNNNVNCDVPAIGRAILHRSLRAYQELAFDLRVIVDQKLDGFLVLTASDLKGKSGISNRGDFP